MRCVCINAAVGAAFPGSKRAMDIEGCLGMWQSIQFFLMEDLLNEFILQNVPCSWLWHVIHR